MRPVQLDAVAVDLGELRARAAVGAARHDVGEEVAEVLPEDGLGRVELVLRLPVLGAPPERLGDQRVPVDRERLVGEDVHHAGRRVDGDAHRGVERDAGQAHRVLRADQADARVGHVHLGARHVELGPGPDLEEALGAPQVQVGAIEGLRIDDDQPAREQQVVVRLLHDQRDEVLLQLDRFPGELAVGLGRIGGRPGLAEVEQELGGGDAGRWSTSRRLTVAVCPATPVNSADLFCWKPFHRPLSCGRSGDSAWATRCWAAT